MRVILIVVALLFGGLAQVSGQNNTTPRIVSGAIPAEPGWYELANTRLRQVDPCPKRDCPYSGVSGQHDVTLTSPPNSAAFDTKRNRLILGGGGHAGYWGNELYALNIDSFTVERITEPGLPLQLCTGTTAEGTQPDSRHTWDGLAYMANVDKMFLFGGFYSCPGAGAFLNDTWTFDFTEKKWQRMNPSGSLPANGPYITSVYDSTSGGVLVTDRMCLFSYDISSNKYTTLSQKDCRYPYGAFGVSYHRVGIIDPVQQKYFLFGSKDQWVFDLSPGSKYLPERFTTTGGDALVNSPYPGLAYDPVSGHIIGWNNGNTVYSLDIQNKTWTPMTFPGGPPLPRAGYAAEGQVGTLKRWSYVPKLNGFVVLNHVDDNAFFFRLPSSDTPPPIQDTTPPTSADTNAPSVPQNLAATAVSSSQADLSWTASTDTVGVTGYKLYRNGTEIVTVTSGTTYQNTDLTASTAYSYAVAAYDAAGNLSNQSESVSATTQAVVAPLPSGTVVIGGYPMPSLADEKATYQKWGWAWTVNQEPNLPSPYFGTNRAGQLYGVYDPDIHGDTEGDDLWSYLMMYQRTNQQGYLDRATAWARYFKDDYRQCVGGGYKNYCYDRNGFNLDHLYGWGLLAWHEYTTDSSFLAAAENLGEDVETWYNKHPHYKPGRPVAHYSMRQPARHLLLSTRLADVTKNPRWIALRDRMIALFLHSPDWDDTRGMYWDSEYTVDAYAGKGAYASGLRMESPFILSIVGEAFDYAYRSTGNPELRNRMVAIARYVEQYGLDANYQYTGSRFGLNIKTGKAWHSYSGYEGIATHWDPGYTMTLVNTLVRGYKYTGEQHFLDQAKHFFNRGTKGINEEPIKRAAADNVVGHFIDTTFSSSSGYFYLDGHKGELQYIYLIFENGGNPIVLSTTPPPPLQDTTPPSVPQNLTVAAISTSQINLSWTVSTDAAEITGYKVYRGSAEIATVTSDTSYQDKELTSSTAYSYTVAAYDVAGNLSNQSESVSATTQAVVAPPPSSITIPGAFLQRKFSDSTWLRCEASGAGSKAALAWILALPAPAGLSISKTGVPTSTRTIMDGKSLIRLWDIQTTVTCVAIGKSADLVLALPATPVPR